MRKPTFYKSTSEFVCFILDLFTLLGVCFSDTLVCLLCFLKRGDAGAACCDGFRDCRRTDARACRNGMSALMVASMVGHASCVEALIREKADLLHVNK